MTKPRKRGPAPAGPQGGEPTSERLQKVLAAAGIGSRRECEVLILEGRVEVDRTVVDQLGSRVDPEQQEIRVDGVVLTNPRRLYYAVNKPVGVVCTNSDPDGRTRVVDLINTDQRLFPVGRLDRTSEGLIIVTNDGELANRLTHPRYGVSKKYLVRVAGQPTQEQLESLLHGVHLAEGFAKAAAIHVKKRQKQCTDMEITLDEGRNREIRRLLARVGHKVVRLKRIAMGSLTLGELPVGGYRKLTDDELRELEACVSRAKSAAQAEPRVTGKIRPSRTQGPGMRGSKPGTRGSKPGTRGSAKARPSRPAAAGQARPPDGRPGTRPPKPDARAKSRPPRPGQPSRPGKATQPGRPARPAKPPTGPSFTPQQGSILGYDDGPAPPPQTKPKDRPPRKKPRP